ncbi:helix-turn-helix transcriptional regulator [Helcococcus kunzii]|uniref:helix-turn-helix transcriptional regulator n=1 Tax=Helcococcus kunzii TaxID=40091 RepID=UPI00389B4586
MDLIAFSKKLKELRIQRNLTQIELSDLSGISRRKIIDIENNNSIPSIEDLITLSNIYKIELIHLFYDYNKFHNIDIKSSINEIENFISDKRYDEVKIKIDNLKQISISNPFIKQYYNFVYGFYYLNSKEKNYNKSIEHLLTGLMISNKHFTINNYKHFSYSSIELRALIALSKAYLSQGNKLMYKEIVEFCYNSLQEINTSYFIVTIQYATLKSREEDFNYSIEITNNCIDTCCEVNNFTYLPFLYYLNYINYKKIENTEFANDYLSKSLVLCDIYKKYNLKRLIENKQKKKKNNK